MTIWVFLTLMFGLSAGFFFTPGRHLLFASLILCTGLLSFGLYKQIGSPLLMSGDSEVTHIEDMVATLADRLQRDPDDLDGWIMLGRSYMTLGKPADAVVALQKAVDIEHSGNVQTLLRLGEAMYSANKQYLNPRIITLFEKTLLLAPRDPNALYWSGLGAAAQRRYQIAVERWEQLRSMAPPDRVTMIDEGITKWREAGGLDDLQPAAAAAVDRTHE